MTRDYESSSDGFGFIVKIVLAVVSFLVVVIVGFSSYYTIDQGERGVVLHYGAIAEESEPGLHFKMPFVTSVEKISVQQQKIAFDVHDKDNDFWMQAYSRDQQPATIAVNVLYHITNVGKVYSLYGGIDELQQRFIDPKVLEQVKNVFGQFNAVNAIQDRADLNAKVYAAVHNAATTDYIMVDSVQIEDISFSDKYEKAVEDRMEAQVRQQQAEAAKAKRIIDADAAAYEVRANADAQAHATEVKGQAEAQAIKARGDALRDNPNLVALTTAEKWDGQLPGTMVSGGTVPLLNLKGQ